MGIRRDSAAAVARPGQRRSIGKGCDHDGGTPRHPALAVPASAKGGCDLPRDHRLPALAVARAMPAITSGKVEPIGTKPVLNLEPGGCGGYHRVR